MHEAQIRFCQDVKKLFPDRFRGCSVLDIGSLDVNGNNRYLFEEAEYVGVDVAEGPNVDVVGPIHTITKFPPGSFDVVISTESFEHDMHFVESLRKAVELLKPGGLFFFTAAGEGRGEHGTRRTTPGDSPLTVNIPGWGDFYKNVTREAVEQAVNLSATFSASAFASSPGDIYFWGIKRPSTMPRLCVPTLKRYDLLEKLIQSAEAGSVRPSGYVIVDNGGKLSGSDLKRMGAGSNSWLITPSRNLGVAASWNLMLDMSQHSPVVISNDDVILGKDTFANICRALDAGAQFVGNGWFLFAQTPECTQELVGYYDENFYPAYCEDSDYEVRLHRAGVTRHRIPQDFTHVTFASSTPDESNLWRARAREYFEKKWGGIYLGEVPISSFGEPWGGHPPAGWKLRR